MELVKVQTYNKLAKCVQEYQNGLQVLALYLVVRQVFVWIGLW